MMSLATKNGYGITENVIWIRFPLVKIGKHLFSLRKGLAY
jgi:hypothetical protein